MNLKSFDIFGKKTDLRVSKSTDSIQTNTGGFISIVSVLIVMTYTSFLSYKMVNRLNVDMYTGHLNYKLLEEGIMSFDRFEGAI